MQKPMASETTWLKTVREHAEHSPVWISEDEDSGRLIVCAQVRIAHASASIDLLDLIAWLKENRPDLIKETSPAQ